MSSMDGAETADIYRGLTKCPDEKSWLTDTCLDGQDTFKKILDSLDIPYDT